MKRSVPAALQVWPGVTPWTGVAAGAVEQAASSAGARRTILRIDWLLRVHNHPAHLQFPALDGEGHPSFDEIERVLAELLVAPARQDAEVLAHSGGERLEIVRAGDETRCDAGFLGANLEQQLQEIADQRSVLGEAGPLGLAVRHFARLQRLGRLDGRDQPRADVIGSPAGR